MTKTDRGTVNLIIFTIIASMLFVSCGQKPQEPKAQQQSQAVQEADKVPDQLQAMENSVEQIIQTLNGPAVIENKGQGAQNKGSDQNKDDSSKKDEGQSSGKGSSDKEGGDKESSDKSRKGDESQEASKQGESKSQEGEQKQAPQPPQPQDPWEKITPIVNNLHYQWNAYLPLALKKGANRQLVDSFSSALNSLTNTVIGRNKTNTLLASSYLYAYIPEFYFLYRTESSPEIKKIRHYIRNATLNAMTANWTQADTDMNNLKSSWNLFKNTVPKDQQDNASKLDYSIYELEKVIKEKNQPLIDIKGRVALSNVQALDKSSGK